MAQEYRTCLDCAFFSHLDMLTQYMQRPMGGGGESGGKPLPTHTFLTDYDFRSDS